MPARTPETAHGRTRAAPPASPGWFCAIKRAYLLDFQMPDSADQMPLGQPRNLRNMDPERIVRELRDHGVEALYVHAKDNQGNCYYDTAIGHKHTGIGDRDLMREFSAHCRATDMKILYYVQLSRERRANEDPLYAARRHDGSPVVLTDPTPQLPSPEERPVACLNGPFREYQLAIIRELAERYDFDGLWLDAFGWWGRTNPCYCDFCKAKYRTDTGATLPEPSDKESAAWKQYFAWRRRLNHLILHELIDAAKAVNPRLTVTHNGSGTLAWADWKHCTHDDYVTHEFHYNDGLANLGLLCRKQRALKPDRPFEIEIWRFFNRPADTPRGYQVRPVAMHEVEMATVLAHGGFVQYYDQINPDGTLDHRSLAVMKQAFDFVREREPLLDASDGLMPYCGLVWSKATDAFAQPLHARRHASALEGAHHALVEAHVPVEVLGDHQIAAGEFRGHRVVVLPDVECMSNAEAAALEVYVREGGGLVATHRTSLCDERGTRRQDFALTELFGCEYLEPVTYLHSFMQPEIDHPVNDGLELGWPRTLWKVPQVKVRVRPGGTGSGGAGEAAEAIACVVNPMRGFHMGHPPAERTPHPSIVVRRYGKGRVVYFAAPIDHAYAEYGHPDHARWLVNAVRWAAGEMPPLELDAPGTVEMVVWEHAYACARGDGVTSSDEGTELRIHLVNRTAAGPLRGRSAVFQEHLPVLDLTLHVHGRSIGEATLQPDGRRLEITRDNDSAHITIPRLDVYGIVVLR